MSVFENEQIPVLGLKNFYAGIGTKNTGNVPVWKISNGTVNPLLRPSIKENRSNDVSFSFSKEIPGDTHIKKREWIYNFLKGYGVFEGYEQISGVIKRMKLSPNIFKEQVVIECVNAKVRENVYQILLNKPKELINVMEYSLMRFQSVSSQ